MHSGPVRGLDAVAGEGHSNLFALVPVAAGLDDTPEIRAAFRDEILDDIAANAGVDLRDRVVVEETFSIDDFAARYTAERGTALGLAHTLGQTALFRPPHVSTEMEGLFYTGAYTTPGIGVPMCLIGGKVTAEKMAEAV